jgi:hypothetical protein
VDSKIRSHDAYFVNDWKLWTEPFEEITSHAWPNTGAYLLLISLLSLVLWAVIWGAVASLFSATL